jgi:hypothetical protein
MEHTRTSSLSLGVGPFGLSKLVMLMLRMTFVVELKSLEILLLSDNDAEICATLDFLREWRRERVK